MVMKREEKRGKKRRKKRKRKKLCFFLTLLFFLFFFSWKEKEKRRKREKKKARRKMSLRPVVFGRRDLFLFRLFSSSSLGPSIAPPKKKQCLLSSSQSIKNKLPTSTISTLTPSTTQRTQQKDQLLWKETLPSLSLSSLSPLSFSARTQKSHHSPLSSSFLSQSTSLWRVPGRAFHTLNNVTLPTLEIKQQRDRIRKWRILALSVPPSEMAKEVRQIMESESPQLSAQFLGEVTPTTEYTAEVIKQIEWKDQSLFEFFVCVTTLSWTNENASLLISLLMSSPSLPSFCDPEKKLQGCGKLIGLAMRLRDRKEAGLLFFNFIKQSCQPGPSIPINNYLNDISQLIGAAMSRLATVESHPFSSSSSSGLNSCDPENVEIYCWQDEDLGFLLLGLKHDLEVLCRQSDLEIDDFYFVCQLIPSVILECSRQKDDRFVEHLISSLTSTWESSVKDARIEELLGNIRGKILEPSFLDRFWGAVFPQKK